MAADSVNGCSYTTIVMRWQRLFRSMLMMVHKACTYLMVYHDYSWHFH